MSSKVETGQSRLLASPARRRLLLGAGGTLALSGLGAMGMANVRAGRTLQPADEPIPRSYFGMHIHNADTSTPWPSAHFGSWRLWDAHVSWPQLQPQRGQWDFRRLDKYVAMARLVDVDLLLPLGLSPAWASARANEVSAYGLGNAAEPVQLEDWKQYVRTVAMRYKGRIRHYELWNEPNLRNFYSGDVDTMLSLAREAYAILKQAAPDNLLAAPATTEGGKQLDWLNRYLAQGGGQYLDVLSHHFYVPRESPEAMLAVMRDIQSILDKHGLSNKPIWNTETGWWIDRPNASSSFTSWKKLQPDEAAAYVSRALLLGWAMGMRRFYWYSWEHSTMGLIDERNFMLNDAGKAYIETQAWMEGAVMTACESVDGRWTCSLRRGQSEISRVVWLDERPATPWRIPAEWQIREIVRLDGSRQSIQENVTTIGLGASPVLLRS
jgi:hypothetical protein